MRGLKKKRMLKASYTVEATLIMAVTLFLIASLLRQAFDIHGEVVGNLILQDTMEQISHREKEKKPDEIVGDANEELHKYFWCGGRKIDVRESGTRIEGWMRDEDGKNQETAISVKTFDPESFLRLIRAVAL